MFQSLIGILVDFNTILRGEKGSHACVSIPDRDFSGFQLKNPQGNNTITGLTVSIPDRDFSGFQPSR